MCNSDKEFLWFEDRNCPLFYSREERRQRMRERKRKGGDKKSEDQEKFM